MEIYVRPDRRNSDVSRAMLTGIRMSIKKRLDNAAAEGWKAAKKEIETKLDRPTPFTQRAAHYTKSKLGSLQAVVALRERQAEYLAPSIEGGAYTGNLRGKMKPVPFTSTENRYGNMPGGLTKRPNSFSTRRSGIGGKSYVGLKRGRNTRLVGIWTRRNTFAKKMDFYGPVRSAAAAGFRAAM